MVFVGENPKGDFMGRKHFSDALDLHSSKEGAIPSWPTSLSSVENSYIGKTLT